MLKETTMARILIVEDNPTEAQQLAILLGDAGFDVEIAPDATQGYATAAQGSFDLVMADVHLPDENGFQLCRRIKANEWLKNTRVLIDTADSNPKNVLRGLEAHADGFMTKDHSPFEIVGRVQRTLSGGARRIRVGDVDYMQVTFQNGDFLLTPTIEQLLNILLSAFEDVINLNDRLKANETALLQLNEEIRRANHALEEVNNLGDQFLSIAAHDLRNPLGNISVMASMMMQNQCDREEQMDFLRSMVHESEQMLLLIQDLLSASATRSGKLELKPVFQDPVKILRQAFDGFMLIARKKGIKLVWEVPSTLPSAELDTLRIAEVLSNLLSNSLKFCSRDQSVYLGAGAVDSHLEISVRDTGPGIKQEELPRLFEPFTKLSNKPTAGEPSTGLGLSIVKQIVELHGGQVSVESATGQGTTFRLLLPLHYSRTVTE
jgi:signal transduction histidine kinase